MVLPDWATNLVRAAATSGEDAAEGLRLAAEFGWQLPHPGSGETALRWQVLAAVAEQELTAARILEAHSDALAILAEAGVEPPAGPDLTWGVFAAEAPSVRLEAEERDGDWTVTGTKPWCSLGDQVTHALVTAHVDGGRRLFAVDLRSPTVRAAPPSVWVARGLRTVTSGPVEFDASPARPVGATDWYLHRPGFAWGGLGVAACWAGGASGLVHAIAGYAEAHPQDGLTLAQLGRADAALYGARCALSDAAVRVDGAEVAAGAGDLLVLRVRAVVAEAVETILRCAAHALGPAPLAFDDRFARRVADLELYVRQHHAERDLAALGSARLERA